MSEKLKCSGDVRLNSKKEPPPSPSPGVPGEGKERGLLVGWTSESENKSKRRIGFTVPVVAKSGGEILSYAGDGHLLTVVPTGAGKGRSAAIPALLKYPGSTLTIDLKGEAYHITARRRRQMGHRVVVFDPFRIAVDEPDTLIRLICLRCRAGRRILIRSIWRSCFAGGSRSPAAIFSGNGMGRGCSWA